MPSPNDLCIYCLRSSTQAPPEHIIPEVLGCPEAAVLRGGEVCERCNNGVAHLDQALADSFDFARFFVNQPTKKGKGPSITGRSNLTGSVTDGHAAISVNFGPGDVTLPDGRVLKAPARSGQKVDAEMWVYGSYAKIKFRAPAFQNPKFARAVHKVALEGIAGMLGREVALLPSLNAVREYVRHGTGPERAVLCGIPPQWHYFNRVWPPYTSPDGYCVSIALAGIEILVDCTSGQSSVPRLLSTMQLHPSPYHWVMVN